MMTNTTTTTTGAEAAGGELIQFPHSGLRVPHTRLTASRLEQSETSRGVAFTATLLMDGTPVASIENRGCGGATWATFVDRKAYGEREFDEFVQACRDAAGEPVSDEQVLQDLVTEHQYSAWLRELARRGRTIVRWMVRGHDGDGKPVGDPFPMQERSCRLYPGEAWRQALADGLVKHASGDHGWWELWNGERWERLPAPRTAAAQD
ncbi:hypothetical protein AB0B10_25765 [Micromonospora arborensis]|uniref:hypothetical protein n=1 Tax=Micromonospora arborensis TaxID=2116518 RepID=UPI0033D1FA5D